MKVVRHNAASDFLDRAGGWRETAEAENELILGTGEDNEQNWMHHSAGQLETIYRVWAVCNLENNASAGVREKVGMQRERIHSRYIVHPNVSVEPRECFVYARVR